MNLSYNSIYTELFEKEIAKRCNAKYCLATITGSAALQLAITTAKKTPKESPYPFVATQALTFISTANAAQHLNLPVRLYDIDDKRCLIPAKYTEDIIIPVHLDRRVGDIEKLYKLNKGKIIISDACQAFGIWKLTKELAGCLSFNWNKILTTGQGGALLTNDKAYYERAKHLSMQARLPHDIVGNYRHDEVGFNYRMSGLNAIEGLKRLKDFNPKKKGIERPLMTPLTELEIYKDCKRGELKNTYKLWLSGAKGVEYKND